MAVRLGCVARTVGIAAIVGIACGALPVAEPDGQQASLAAAAEQQSPELRDAEKRFLNQDFDGAYRALVEARRQDPTLPPAQVMMAGMFSQINAPGGVRLYLERAAKEEPNDPEAFVIMGEIAIGERRVTEAGMLFNHARSLLPNFKGGAKRKDPLERRTLAGLATYYEAREEWANAEKYLLEWEKLEPREAIVKQRLANALFRQDRAKEAYDKLKQAKEVDPRALTPEAQMALFYQQKGDSKRAAEWMTSALGQAKDDPNTLVVAASWALENDRLEDAKKWASDALKYDKTSIPAMLLRGTVALFQKQYEDAEFYFETAFMQSPGTFAASNNLALALIEQEKHEQYARKRQKALELAENNVRQFQRTVWAAEAWSTYGWILYKNNRPQQALQALQQAAASGALSEDTRYYLAVVLLDQDRREEARRLLREALESKRPFSKRDDAKLLLERLGGAGAAETNRQQSGSGEKSKPESTPEKKDKASQ